MTHNDIYNERERIWIFDKSQMKFKKSGQIKDQQGHGTFIVGLVLEYAPDAELFVADISSRRRQKDGTFKCEADRDRVAEVSHRTGS